MAKKLKSQLMTTVYIVNGSESLISKNLLKKYKFAICGVLVQASQNLSIWTYDQFPVYFLTWQYIAVSPYIV